MRKSVLANVCEHEATRLSCGLKTASRVYGGSGSAWSLNRTETYGYDAAGNRASDSANPGNWTYDNLNRILTSPQGSYEHSPTGDLQTGPAGGYEWDVLGHMVGFESNSASATYGYRADGLRIFKTDGQAVNSQLTGKHEMYRYDGQMPVETVEMTGTTVDAVQRHALGARGTDMIERTTSTATQTRFPLYDAHGNSVATLGRSGTSWSVGDERSYDAWGKIRPSEQRERSKRGGTSSGVPPLLPLIPQI